MAEANLKIKVDFDAKAANTQIRNMQSYLKNLQTSSKNLTTELQAKQKQLSEVRGLMAQGGTASSMQEWADEEARLVAETQKLDSQLSSIEAKTKQISSDIVNAQLNPSTFAAAEKETDDMEKNVRKASTSSTSLKKSLSGITKAGKSATGAFSKFGNRLKGIASGALFFNAISAGLTALRQGLGSLITSNSTLAASLGRIKGNLLTAFQPIWDAILPALQTLFSWIEKVTGALAKFIAGVFGTTAQQASKNAQALQAQASATKETAKETKLASASFDTLSTLSSGDDDTRAVTAGATAFTSGLSGELDSIDTSVFEKPFAPLKEIDFGPISDSLAGLREALKPLAANMFSGLEWVYNEILVPISQWAIETLFPHILDLIAAQITALNNIIEALKPGLQFLWDNLLKPIGEWLGTAIINIIDRFKAAYEYLSQSIQEHSGTINKVIQGVVVVFRTVFEVVKGVIDSVIALIGNLLKIIIDVVMDVFEVLGGVVDFIVGIFTGDIDRALKGLGNIFIGLANIIIDALNALWSAVYAVVSGIVNGLGDAIGWIGSLIGQEWGWEIPSDPPLIPRIPYLAQGAVLPPNKPFAAIVGDQKNGTNIEAPLATIVEAMNMALNARGADNITLNVTGNLAALFKYLNINIEKEKRRATAF